jgi:hypothetical protein
MYRDAQKTCQFDEAPGSLLLKEAGIDLQFNLRFSCGNSLVHLVALQ